MASKRLGAEGGRGDDACAADTATLQQSGATVACHEVVGSACQGCCQQENIIRIIRLDAFRQRRQDIQDDGALHIVDQRGERAE